MGADERWNGSALLWNGDIESGGGADQCTWMHAGDGRYVCQGTGDGKRGGRGA